MSPGPQNDDAAWEDDASEDAAGEDEPVRPEALQGAELERAYRSLVRDVEQALLSEIGARAVYDHIARRARDEDLGRLADELNREGIEIVETVQALVRSMGGRARRTSLRRRALARGLVTVGAVVGARPVLRLVRYAEETVGRWYAEYALFLVRIGDPDRARAFEDLRARKERRALVLGAWVDNLARQRDRRL
ncbi:MAG: hypothetical protein AAF957_00170 [Planctomycetota bacterium]